MIKEAQENGILKKKEAKYLIPEAPRVPIIYQLPKIHKNINNPPGRTIVSGVDSLFSRMGEYLDCFLQPFVQKCPAYLKDSKDLIGLLQHINIEEEHIIASIDVESLYTNTKQQHALEAVAWALETTDIKPQQKDFLMEALELAMSHNFFWHESKFFRQKKGVAMGAKYAPSVANLFMSHWEEEAIFDKNIPDPKFYKRYIDDIIIVWTGTQETFEGFLADITNNHFGISLSANSATDSIHFLDLVIFKQNGHLVTKTHFKDVDRNGYIPLGSCRHPRWLGGVPKSQMMRVRRNIKDYE